MLIEAESLGARLALLQGQVPDASRWASMLGDSVMLMLLLHIPHLTLANVLLARGTPEALLEAKDLLAWLRQSAKATHNAWRVMEIKAMQAVLKEAEGQREQALALLEEVVAWAEPQGFVRLFVDLGPRTVELLDRLRWQGVAVDYITQILLGFEQTDHRRPTMRPAAGPSSALIEPLTNRELEVLELLARRLTNKEIAADLVVSPATIRTHTYNIYQKLNVHGRRQAVRKARDRGILS
jgi:LuxR family maltose regulon positive regulatory protein